MQKISFFATEKRDEGPELEAQIKKAADSDVARAILATSDDMVFVLNRYRQVLAFNPQAGSFPGIVKDRPVLGSRLGEVLGCHYAFDNPKGGCGTGRYCSTCGAVLSILKAQQSGHAEKLNCALRCSISGQTTDLCLLVRTLPAPFIAEGFLLLFARDISDAERKTAIERIFFHDILNTVNSIVAASTILAEYPLEDQQETIHMAKTTTRLALQLSSELKAQRALGLQGDGQYRPCMSNIELCRFLKDTLEIFGVHPGADGRKIALKNEEAKGVRLNTDSTLLYRVLSNMLLNACEASRDGDEVALWTELSPDGEVTIKVNNPSVMKQEIAGRVFQQFFSTKERAGRGLGTYSMKLIGEKHLGGKVGFASEEGKGTTFYITLETAA